MNSYSTLSHRHSHGVCVLWTPLVTPCARMRSRGRVFGLSVCLFVHHFLGFLCVRGIFKVSIYAWQVDLLIKVARRWSAIERDVLEARKTLVKLQHRYGPPFLIRSAIRTCKRYGRMRTLSSNCMDWYGRMRTLTRRVHPWNASTDYRRAERWKCKNLRDTPKLSFQRRGNRESRRLRKGTIATLRI